MRIFFRIIQAIETVFSLREPVREVGDSIKNRSYGIIFFWVIACVVVYFLHSYIDINERGTEVSIYDSQGIYEVSDAVNILKDINLLTPSDIEHICDKYEWICFDRASSSVQVLPDEFDSETGTLYYHTACAAIDGSLQFSWQEGVDGAGVGSSLTLGFNGNKRIKFLAFYLGNWRGDQNKFDENYIPSVLDLRINGEFIDDLRFVVEKEVQYVIFENAVNVKEMTLTIKESQPGRGMNPAHDCCIAEVCAFG